MNQHDETRKILELIRENKRKVTSSDSPKVLITEQQLNVQEEKDLDKVESQEEERKFRETITPRVKFDDFRLYPKAQNVEWSGQFTDSRIEWFYSLDDTRGVYITADLLQLNDEVLKQIQKLVGYYKTWSDEWANRIAEEYQNEVKDEENAEEGPQSANAPSFGEEGSGEALPQPPVQNA